MLSHVVISPTAARMMQQMGPDQRAEIDRALANPDSLLRSATRLASENRVWKARAGSGQRILFTVENESVVVLGVYDRAYLDLTP